MSIRGGAFGSSRGGAFIMSRGGARGWGGADYYVVGQRQTTPNFSTIYRFDSGGNVTYSGDIAGTDVNFVAVDLDGNMYYTSTGAPTGNMVGKKDSAGNTLWTYSLPSNPQGLAVDADRSVYVGVAATAPTANFLKLDSSGALVWSLALLGSGGRVDVGPSGDIYITSSAAIATANAARVTNAGSIVWTKQLNAAFSIIQGVAVDNDENPHFAALTGSARVFKLDSAGNTIWTVPNTSTAALDSIDVDAAGNVYVGGNRRAAAPNNNLYKFDSSGALQWGYDTGALLVQGVSCGGGRVFVADLRNAAIPASVTVLTTAGALVRVYDTRRVAYSTANSKSLRALRT